MQKKRSTNPGSRNSSECLPCAFNDNAVKGVSRNHTTGDSHSHDGFSAEATSSRWKLDLTMF